MASKKYAHTSGTDKANWQTLEDHLTNVADLAAHFSQSFGCEKLAYAAGLLHDLGKVHDEFQTYLEKSALGNSSRCRVNHSEAGAAYAFQRISSPLKDLIANVVVGHHTGLADYDNGPASYKYRKERGEKDLDVIKEQITPYIQGLPDPASLFPTGFQLSPESYHFLVRFVFSALVDADWLDTERFKKPENFNLRSQFLSLTEYREKFNAHMEALSSKAQNDSSANSSHASLNQMRNQVLADCRAKGRESTGSGLYSLAVPTGGGKTLSSMAFALEHAVKTGKNRIIYVIPYTSIIEQNADVFRGIFGKDAVIEHHSNIDWEKFKKETDSDRDAESSAQLQMELATENWDAPLIVTTNVQFFESLFACQTSRCRKLHNIANSVVILDEAQMLKPELLSVCNSALNELTTRFNTTVVLCTATQPALDSPELKNYTEKYLPLNPPTLINSNPNALYEALRRVEYHIDLETPETWDSLSDKLIREKQVLCIVNTRKDCYELYNAVKAKAENATETVFHLSALMNPEHRTKRIDQIKQRLNNGAPVCVISTQLVEAGVDIDFPVVYRASAGLDSILQSGGRCNREGKLDGLGQVYVFKAPSKIPEGTMHKAEGSFKELWNTQPDLQKPDSYRRYSQLFIAKLNSTREIEIANTKTSIDVLTELCNDCEYVKCMNLYPQVSLEEINEYWNEQEAPNIDFRKIGENLHWIDDKHSVPVVTMYDRGQELVDQLRAEGPNKTLMRQLQRYMVNIPRNKADMLLKTGELQMLECGILVQNDSFLYSDEFGLNLFNDSKTPLRMI
ncbi:MAG: CRISPR-associated helicase Cas3' [Thermoguttaceae bacterium]|nr:CRISPR-associated helicase Cas3' [Thermoguttaceae bacterium]